MVGYYPNTPEPTPVHATQNNEMASFDKINLEQLSKDEGGFVNHPNDPGKATNRGVTIATWNAAAAKFGWTPGVEGLKKITQAQWVKIAKTYYWDALRLDSVSNQSIADAIFHITWGSGPGNSAFIVQRALNDAGVTVKIDGLWGPETRAGIARANPAKLLPAIVSRHYTFLDNITAPGTLLNVFREGLMSRAEKWYASWTTLLNDAGAFVDNGGGAILTIGAMIFIGWVILK